MFKVRGFYKYRRLSLIFIVTGAFYNFSRACVVGFGQMNSIELEGY